MIEGFRQSIGAELPDLDLIARLVLDLAHQTREAGVKLDPDEILTRL